MRRLGIDPCSTKNVGFAVLDDDKIDYVGHCTIGSEVFLSLNELITDLLDDGIEEVCIERSIGAGFLPVRERICENTGAIKLICALRKIPVIAMNTNSAVKTVIGTIKKGTKKQRTIEYVKDRIGFPVNEHEADAVIMCLAAQGGTNG